LLQTFPEKAQVKKKERSKVTVAAILILLGVLLVFSSFLLAVLSPTELFSTSNVTLSNRAIPQNTTIYLAGLVVQNNTSHVIIEWNASNPIVVYVLNSTHYDALLLQHDTNGHFLENFTGMPLSYVSQYDFQNSHVSLTLPQGKYRLFAWSANNTTLYSLSLTQQQNQAVSSFPLVYLIAVVPSALGIFMIALAILILARRVWR
jgi:hypothetical protein